MFWTARNINGKIVGTRFSFGSSGYDEGESIIKIRKNEGWASEAGIFATEFRPNGGAEMTPINRANFQVRWIRMLFNALSNLGPGVKIFLESLYHKKVKPCPVG